MRVRVFLRCQNPAIDKPAFVVPSRDLLLDEFFTASPGQKIGRGRALKIDRRTMQLLARGPQDPEHVSTYANWSGGDPARWAIVGQTSRDAITPGFPSFQMIPCGVAGITSE